MKFYALRHMTTWYLAEIQEDGSLLVVANIGADKGDGDRARYLALAANGGTA